MPESFMRLRLTVNGEDREFDRALTVEGLLGELKLNPAKIAIERNLEIVPRSAYGVTQLQSGDRLEIVQFIGGGNNDVGKSVPADKPFVIAGKAYRSRLIIGTGKYKD
ncbi:MAG: sulfur carrier protein ThiS, partial [Methylocella sp.]